MINNINADAEIVLYMFICRVNVLPMLIKENMIVALKTESDKPVINA